MFYIYNSKIKNRAFINQMNHVYVRTWLIEEKKKILIRSNEIFFLLKVKRKRKIKIYICMVIGALSLNLFD